MRHLHPHAPHFACLRQHSTPRPPLNAYGRQLANTHEAIWPHGSHRVGVTRKHVHCLPIPFYHLLLQKLYKLPTTTHNVYTPATFPYVSANLHAPTIKHFSTPLLCKWTTPDLVQCSLYMHAWKSASFYTLHHIFVQCGFQRVSTSHHTCQLTRHVKYLIG